MVIIIKLLVVARRVCKEIHLHDVLKLNVNLISIVPVIGLVSIINVLIRVRKISILHVLKMLYVLSEIMRRTANAQKIYRMEIQCPTVKRKYHHDSRNVCWIQIVPVRWLVFVMHVLIPAKTLLRAPKRQHAVYWTVRRCVLWFVNVQSFGFPIKMANAGELYFLYKPDVHKTMNALIMNHASTDNAVILAIVVFTLLAMS